VYTPRLRHSRTFRRAEEIIENAAAKLAFYLVAYFNRCRGRCTCVAESLRHGGNKGELCISGPGRKDSTSDNAQFELLRACLRLSSYCAAVENGSSRGTGLVEGKKLNDIKPVYLLAQPVLSALRPVRTRDGKSVCLFVRFSGGTASAWLVEAWELRDGALHDLDTSDVRLNGEVFESPDLFKKMESIARRLRGSK
jgi:hypothetical protein